MGQLYNISELSYDVTRQPGYFTKAIFGGSIIERGLVKILPNIKKTTKLNEINITDSVLQDDNADCSWNPEGEIKLSESVLNVKTFKINLEDCIEKFESVWLSALLAPGAEVDALPTGLEAATLELIAVKTSEQIETLLFSGDGDVENQFDGYVKILTNAPDTIKVAGSTLTKANVASEIEKAYVAIPEAVLQKGGADLKIFASFNTVRVLKMALSNINSQVISTEFSIVDGVVRFLDVEVVPAKGITNSQLIIANINNLLFGSDLISDFTNIELGTFSKPNNNKIWIKGRMRMGAAVVYPDEVVLYAPVNSVNVNKEKEKGGK
ncbi:hypothetical protein EZS27_004651 [termite gut metagenome]|uniref:Phage major capsid protein n=1 Tax=termite gut metagenome TaxID=433724 RepID=A0A5J4SR39_9ZZZZ